MTYRSRLPAPRLDFLNDQENDRWPGYTWKCIGYWMPILKEYPALQSESGEDYFLHVCEVLTRPTFQFLGFLRLLAFIKTTIWNRARSALRRAKRLDELAQALADLQAVAPLTAEEEEQLQREAIEVLEAYLKRRPGKGAARLLAVTGRILAEIGALVPPHPHNAEGASARQKPPRMFFPFAKYESGPRKGMWHWNVRLCSRALHIPERTMKRILIRLDRILNMPKLLGELESKLPPRNSLFAGDDDVP